MPTPNDLKKIARLTRPAEFQKAYEKSYPTLFPNRSTLRWHITQRDANGLTQARAVVDTPSGLMIDPPRFLDWWLAQGDRKAA